MARNTSPMTYFAEPLHRAGMRKVDDFNPSLLFKHRVDRWIFDRFPRKADGSPGASVNEKRRPIVRMENSRREVAMFQPSA